MKRCGYLLIEMLIALAIISVVSLIVAYMQVSIIQWHKEAEQYAQALNYAHHALALLQQGKPVPPLNNGFTLAIDSRSINPGIPFTLHEVTVSFKTPRAIQKKISLTGGALNENA